MSIAQQVEVAERLEALSSLEAAARASQRSSRKLRSTLLDGLLSGTHEIPPHYDRLLDAA